MGPIRSPFFPLKDLVSARWTTLKMVKLVTRTMVARGVDAEVVEFPFVTQAARLPHQTDKPSSAMVELRTSRFAAQLSPKQCLAANNKHRR